MKQKFGDGDRSAYLGGIEGFLDRDVGLERCAIAQRIHRFEFFGKDLEAHVCRDKVLVGDPSVDLEGGSCFSVESAEHLVLFGFELDHKLRTHRLSKAVLRIFLFADLHTKSGVGEFADLHADLAAFDLGRLECSREVDNQLGFALQFDPGRKGFDKIEFHALADHAEFDMEALIGLAVFQCRTALLARLCIGDRCKRDRKGGQDLPIQNVKAAHNPLFSFDLPCAVLHHLEQDAGASVFLRLFIVRGVEKKPI